MSGAQQQPGISRQQAEQLGIPQNIKFASPWPFAGINQLDGRTSMKDQEFFWLENYIRFGGGYMRALWDVGDTVYTASGKTIVSHFPFSINHNNYIIIFLSDGTADQINLGSSTITSVSSTPGTFYATGAIFPACSQYGSQYLLITTNLTSNSYWVWDGTLLYGTGTIAPYQNGDITDGGAEYSSAPTVTVYGGSGSGVTVATTIANGSVVSLQILTVGSGYSANDQVQLAFSGGGSDNSPILIAVLASNTVSNIQLISGGSGYVTAPTVGFTGGGGGSGATASATIIAGAVTAVTVTNPGSGYTSTPAVTFTGGSGSGASAVAVLNSGSVASVTIVNGGDGLTGTPTLSFVGGGGTGATATATITSGAISAVAVTEGGSGYTTAPTVVVAPGSNNAAAGFLDVMPFGVSGTTIETFQSRVWVAFPFEVGTEDNGGVINVSAPESLSDFSSTDGGLLYINNDRFLRDHYVALRQSNGYLYPFGDSSTNVISNVQTGGSPTITTFNYQNTDPQIGAAWRDSLQDFGRTILFANQTGVYGLYGGAVTRLSHNLDRVFNAMVLPANGGLLPSAAVATIYTKRVYLMLFTIIDPFTQDQRNVMIGWDEQNWIVASQSKALTYIATQEVNSAMTAWGTDGSTLFPLFKTPSTAITKTFSSKSYGAQSLFLVKQAYNLWVKGEDLSTAQKGLAFNITIDALGQAVQNGLASTVPWLGVTVLPESGSYQLPIQPNFQAASSVTWAGRTGDIYGMSLGWTGTTTAPDFYLSNIVLGYFEGVAGNFG